MDFLKSNKNPKSLRVIKTARDMDKINKAAIEGFWPIIKKVIPSEKIRSKYSILQNKKTGEIQVIGDYRMIFNSDEYSTVIGWTFYYPYNFSSPFAAYLIPKDIKIGERVFIEDLIQDIVGRSWNQGDNYRLECCEAIWNGDDLEILFDPKTNRSLFMG